MGIIHTIRTFAQKLAEALASLPGGDAAAKSVYREITDAILNPTPRRRRGRWKQHRSLWHQRHNSPARRGYLKRRRKAVLRAHRQWPRRRAS